MSILQTRFCAALYFFCFMLFTNFGISSICEVSVLIPCIYSHVEFLPSLLENLSTQTVIPDEVIISASSLTPSDIRAMNKLKQNNYPFDLIILKTEERNSAGTNRNLAFQKSSGHLIIFQDADDIPHPQRIEVSKALYRKLHYDFLFHLSFSKDFKEPKSLDTIQELMNSFTFSNTNWKLTKLRQRNIQMVKYVNSRQAQMKRALGLPYSAPNLLFTFGNIAVRRRVLQTFKYNNDSYGEDSGFFFKAARRFKKNFLIELPLNLYAYIRTSEPIR